MIIDKMGKVTTLESIFAEALRYSCSLPDEGTLLTHLQSWPCNQFENSPKYSLTDIKQAFASCLDETIPSKENELEKLWFFFTIFFDSEEKILLVKTLNTILDNTIFKKFYLPSKVDPPKIMDKAAEKVFRHKNSIFWEDQRILKKMLALAKDNKTPKKILDLKKNKRTPNKILGEKNDPATLKLESSSAVVITLKLKSMAVIIVPQAGLKLFKISDIATAFANALTTLNGYIIRIYPDMWKTNAAPEQTSILPFFISDTLSSSDKIIYDKIKKSEKLYWDPDLVTYFATFSSEDTLKKIYSSIRKLFIEELIQKEETIDTFFLKTTLETLITTFHEIKVPENLDTLFQKDDNYPKNRKDKKFSNYSKKSKEILQNYTGDYLKRNLNLSTIENFIKNYYEAEPIVIQKRSNLNAAYDSCDKKTDIDTILSYFPYILYTIIIAILSNKELSHDLLARMIKVKSKYLSVQKEAIDENDYEYEDDAEYEYEDEPASNNFNRDFYRVLDKVFVPKTSSQYLKSSICFQTYLFKQCICTCLNTCTFEISKTHFFESIFLFIYSFSEEYIDRSGESCTFSEEITPFLQSNSSDLFLYIMELLLKKASVLDTLL